MLTKTKKSKIIKESQKHKTDTGSALVQVAILNTKIEELSKHLKKNPKDNHSRKGLLGMVSKRNSTMKYIEKKSPKTHKEISKKVKAKK